MPVIVKHWLRAIGALALISASLIPGLAVEPTFHTGSIEATHPSHWAAHLPILKAELRQG